jgi:hypothetical protein
MVESYPFEVPYILDEVSGYSYDDMDKIVDTLNELIMDKKLNEEVSRKQSELGIRLFSVEENIHQWKDFLNNL